MLGPRRAGRAGFSWLAQTGTFPILTVSEPAPNTARRGRSPQAGLKRERRVAQNGSEAGSPVAGVAARYASALFELARDERDIDGVAASLDQFGAMLNESADLRRFVRSPVFTGVEQEAAIVALLEKSGIGGIGGNFIRLAAANRRLFALPDMIRAFRTLVRESKGIVRAEVTVAERPSDAVVEEIKASLRDVARSEIDLDLKIDPSLIGGLVVKIGSRMVDASLRTKLNGIRLAMREAR
jgi:F-type H+-transporting ATPase subunit delta